MDVIILATKNCTHGKDLEKELECLQIPYRVCFVEDCPELDKKISIRHSPYLVVDDIVVFRKQSTEIELHTFFSARN